MADTVQTVKVGEPSGPLDAANKKYVDDKTNQVITRYVEYNITINNYDPSNVANGWKFSPLGGHISDTSSSIDTEVRTPILTDFDITQIRCIADELSEQEQQINIIIYQNNVENINANFVIPINSRQSNFVGFADPVKFYGGNYCHATMTRTNGKYPSFFAITIKARHQIFEILDKKEKKIKLK